MKKYFITGLIILLPLTFTALVIIFIFNLLTNPFLEMVKAIFEHNNLFVNGFLFLNASQMQSLVAKILILTTLFLGTVFLGLITRWFFFHSLLRFADRLMHNIPIVNSIYRVCQDIIKTIFTTENKSFKQVVLAPFPTSDTQSIGLITREDMPGLEGTPFANSVAVFVPTTPNPTSGFLMMYNKDDLIYLDMKVEDAFKYVISCGVITTHFTAMKSEYKG